MRRVLVAIALALTGCDWIAGDLPKYRAERDPGANLPAFDLGIAVYPPSTPPSSATKLTWTAVRLNPKTYRIGYALSNEERAEVSRSFRVFAKLLGYEPEKNGKFKWVAPPGCEGDMHCIYDALVSRNYDDVVPIAARFRKRADEAKLSSLDAASLVITWVQAMKYEVPKDEPFGVMPPALTASLLRGDCDSKTLLAHMILYELGIESALLSSNAHRHLMLGVALPAQGSTMTYQGRKYAFTEMTAKNAPIGYIDPRMMRPNDWKVVRVSMPSRRSAAPSSPAPAPVKPAAPRPRR